ncbi:MAG: amidohydrolase family protein [Planctomycetes bacterium]|nr:amidohydrolase family protein [Planctomycetota bacterium]
MRNSIRSLGSFLLVLTMILASRGLAQTRAKVVIEGGRIIPVVGPVIEKGSILIEDGKIVAIGADLKVPFDAKVIDASGKTIFPGLVDPLESRGLDVSNETQDVAPFTEVFDAIDPADRFFEEALRAGITSLHLSHAWNCVIGGLSRVVHPIGLTVDEMTQRANGGLMISVFPKSGYDHAVQLAVLRDTFAELERYLDKLAEDRYQAEQEKKGEKVTVGPEEARKLGRPLIRESDLDQRYLNLWRLTQGKIGAYVWCARAMDLANAKAIAESAGFKDGMTLVTGSECFKNLAALKDLPRPVILPVGSMVHTEKDRITLEDEDSFVPKIYADKKIAFALAGTKEPLYDAARCVRNGVDRQVALEAVTINAAKAIGMDHLVGSIETGKLGNLLILTGDPLDQLSWVDGVLINGVLVYERAKDRRLRDLMLGVADTELRRKADEGKEAKKDAKGEGEKK